MPDDTAAGKAAVGLFFPSRVPSRATGSCIPLASAEVVGCLFTVILGTTSSGTSCGDSAQFRGGASAHSLAVVGVDLRGRRQDGWL